MYGGHLKTGNKYFMKNFTENRFFSERNFLMNQKLLSFKYRDTTIYFYKKGYTKSIKIFMFANTQIATLVYSFGRQVLFFLCSY